MLEINDLSKRYGSVVALDGATFAVRPGRLVGFLGPNGAGKTTTMRCVFGLARPDRGSITWRGKLIDRAHRRRPTVIVKNQPNPLLHGLATAAVDRLVHDADVIVTGGPLPSPDRSVDGRGVPIRPRRPERTTRIDMSRLHGRL